MTNMKNTYTQILIILWVLSGIAFIITRDVYYSNLMWVFLVGVSIHLHISEKD